MRLLLKIICVFVVVLVAVAASGYAWIARDRGPSHPTLAAAEMAPLIPLRDFWANQNSEWGYTLSPRGAYMSWWAVDGADTILKVRDRKSGAVQTIRPANDRAARYEWSYDDRHLLLSHYDADRWSVWRIDAADVASEWGEVTPRGFGNWISTYSPKSANDRRLLATYDRSREFHDLYAVDQDGLGKTLLRRNPGNVQWWRLDREGAVFLRAVNTGPGEFRIEYDPQRDDTGWQPLLSYTARDTVWVLTDDAHGNVIMLSDIGREQLALVRIDPNTRSETVMLEDPSRSIEAWYRFSPAAPAVDVVEFGGGYPEYVAMTPLGEAAMNALEALETPFNMNILSATDDGALVTLVLNEREGRLALRACRHTQCLDGVDWHPRPYPAFGCVCRDDGASDRSQRRPRDSGSFDLAEGCEWTGSDGCLDPWRAGES